jgi:transglutaminase-like putative cysteine protease
MRSDAFLDEPSRVWRRWAACVVLVTAVVTCSSWGSALSVPVASLAPAMLWAAIPAVLAAAVPSTRTVVAAAVVAVPATLLAAGLPFGLLPPPAWHRLAVGLLHGAGYIVARDPPRPAIAQVAAGAGLAASALWLSGAALGASAAAKAGDSREARLRRSLGFVLLAAPWLGSLLMGASGHDAWQGGLVLAAGVIWFSAGPPAVVLGAVVAVVGVALASTLGPPSHWFGPGASGPSMPTFDTLDVAPTYGPLDQRQTGAAMLTIAAPEPALWRMQTLDYEDGSWTVASAALPVLPQPAATLEAVRIRVDGLRENLALAPGRVARVTGPATGTPTEGEGVVLAPTPAAGSTYWVEAAVVHATADQLAHDRRPLDALARAYTRVNGPVDLAGRRSPWAGLLPELETMLAGATEAQVDPKVVTLAHRLAKGVRTEWQIVSRVERYLVESERFRYTTNVPEPGPEPLADFLLRTHAGYCQQFAGAAALLLRLAGVPARVVSGFATGKLVGPDRYVVRDLDAHEWIEIYFEGYGWVPFNPTPSADPVLVAGTVDPLRSSVKPAGRLGELYACAAVLALFAAWVVLWLRRRRRMTDLSTDWLGPIGRRAGCRLGPSVTLTDIRSALGENVGPLTAAVVADVERSRFAPGPHEPVAGARARMFRALLRDLGLLRLLRFWLWSTTTVVVTSKPGGGRQGRSDGAG